MPNDKMVAIFALDTDASLLRAPSNSMRITAASLGYNQPLKCVRVWQFYFVGEGGASPAAIMSLPSLRASSCRRARRSS